MDRQPINPEQAIQRVWILAIIIALGCAVVAVAAVSGTVREASALFWCSGVGVTAAAIGVLRLAGHRRRSDQYFIAFCGLTFPVWGMFLAGISYFIGGGFGWFPALITGLHMAALFQSRRVAVSLVAALVPAWTAAWILESLLTAPATLQQLDGFIIRTAAAAFVWNAVVSLELARAASRALRTGLFSLRPTGLCPHCHYDLTGLPTPICPECGADMSLAAESAGR